MRPYLITAKLMRPSNMKRFPTPELNHSCVRNAYLELEKEPDMLTLAGLLPCLGQDLDQTRGYCYRLEDEPFRQFVLYKKNVGWMRTLVGWERWLDENVGWMDAWEFNPEQWDRFGWRSLQLVGGSFWLRACIILGGNSWPLFSYTLEFALQRRRARKTSV
jgi:hypothetical protein